MNYKLIIRRIMCDAHKCSSVENVFECCIDYHCIDFQVNMVFVFLWEH